jgi:Transglycosylase-like domain
MLRKRILHNARPLTALTIVLIGLVILTATAHAAGDSSTNQTAPPARPTFESVRAVADSQRPEGRIPGYDDYAAYQRQGALAEHAAQARAAVRAYWASVAWHERLAKFAAARAQARADAERARRQAEQARVERAQASAPRTAPVQGEPVAHSSSCGGDLPPCWVLQRESGGSPRAQNPSSTASGLWQFLDSTWAGFGGYARAMDAPVSVQNDKARIVWAGGAGCGNWSAC